MVDSCEALHSIKPRSTYKSSNHSSFPRSCGPFAVLMAYMSEMTPMKYRSLVVMLMGASFSLSNILLPGLAWLVLPNNWDWMLADIFS